MFTFRSFSAWGRQRTHHPTNPATERTRHGPHHNPPIKTFRDRALKTTVWENQSDNGDTYFSVTLAKTYQDRNGKLQDTTSFSQGDLLRVAELSRDAHRHIRELRRELSQEQRQEQSRNNDRCAQGRGDRGGRSGRFQGQAQPGLER